jgi:hypothetical protein
VAFVTLVELLGTSSPGTCCKSIIEFVIICMETLKRWPLKLQFPLQPFKKQSRSNAKSIETALYWPELRSPSSCLASHSDIRQSNEMHPIQSSSCLGRAERETYPAFSIDTVIVIIITRAPRDLIICLGASPTGELRARSVFLRSSNVCVCNESGR